VLAVLLIAGGGLVWLNGEPRQRITQLGAGIGIGLWLLLVAIPGFSGLLALAPLRAQSVGLLIATLVVLALCLSALSQLLLADLYRSAVADPLPVQRSSGVLNSTRHAPLAARRRSVGGGGADGSSAGPSSVLRV
jgi:hypothetical protein